MDRQLFELSETVKAEIENRDYDGAWELIAEGMKAFPDSAVPHNLMGILKEKKGSQADAMKHFRAAWALDPTFVPARVNMDAYASFTVIKEPAYFEEDCPREIRKTRYRVVYDERGVGHMETRKEKDFCAN